ncbi:hypothetical protein EG329_000848 [Mollisiaceae sp. DMI_Dod_QoI]|nr:hypothetical protein EG329_000848 [Helotiales sp. DMI_Dod_QoI]
MSLRNELGVVQSKGPYSLLPAEAIGNVITKTNILISSHRDFLAHLPQRNIDTTRNVLSLTTPPPSLSLRYALPRPQIVGALPECSSVVSSVSSVGTASVSSLSSSLISISSVAAANIASLQGVVQSINAALTAENSARLSIQTSASLAVSSANSRASSALSASSNATLAFSSISSSAESAVSSVQASAAFAIAAAQSSANQSVSSANSALSSIQSSADAQAASLNSAVASASVLASDASATATFAIAQAQASISSLSQQVAADIAASRLAAMNTTKFALAITFAILGSSFLSILGYYLISRYRQRRQEERRLALKEKIRSVRHNSDESQFGPSLSEFPMPVGRETWSQGESFHESRTWIRDGEGSDMRSIVSIDMPIQGARKMRNMDANAPSGLATALAEFPIPGAERGKTWGWMNVPGAVTANGMHEAGNTSLGIERARNGERERERPGMVRKNTLTYDPEHPERPPKFTTWMEDISMAVRPLRRMEEVNTRQLETKRTMGRNGLRNGIGTAI